MADEILLVNLASGWPTGAATDIDEGHVSPNSPDGSVYATSEAAGGGKNDTATLGFTASAVVDADTVDAQDIFIRARSDKASSNSNMTVQLVIGGTPQGSAQSITLTNSFQDFVILGSAGGWNADRTAAEMDGVEVQVVATQSGMPTDDLWEIDSVELKNTYTEPGGGGAIPIIMHHRTKNLGV